MPKLDWDKIKCTPTSEAFDREEIRDLAMVVQDVFDMNKLLPCEDKQFVVRVGGREGALALAAIAAAGYSLVKTGENVLRDNPSRQVCRDPGGAYTGSTGLVIDWSTAKFNYTQHNPLTGGGTTGDKPSE